MIQRINILLLIIFINFLAYPTMAYCADMDICYSGINLNEEEENHIKKNNTVSEEEVHYLNAYHFYNVANYDYGSGKLDRNLNLSIKDPIVQKIPLPPPEQV